MPAARRMIDMYEKHAQIIKPDELELEVVKSYR
jgi:hypothetical protein